MKHLIVLAALAALGGCATPPPGPANYGTRAPYAYGPAGTVAAAAQPADPHQWHTVSVTPVDLPPGAPRPANVTSEPWPAPAQPAAQPGVVYTTPAPVVVQPPVIIEEPYYRYPPITFSLGFGFGHWHHGGWGSVHVAPRWGRWHHH
jgi:hypothetical protein